MSGLSEILKAAEWAATLHAQQDRKGSRSEPYIGHLIEVASLLANVAGVTDAPTIIAAFLHDSVEDGHATRKKIFEEFGAEIAGIVAELSDPSGLGEGARRRRQVEHASSLSRSAKLIKLADKISNVREIAEQPPVDWSSEEIKDYVLWGKKVVERLRGTNASLEQLFDQVAEAALTRAHSIGPDSPSIHTSPSA